MKITVNIRDSKNDGMYDVIVFVEATKKSKPVIVATFYDVKCFTLSEEEETKQVYINSSIKQVLFCNEIKRYYQTGGRKHDN